MSTYVRTTDRREYSERAFRIRAVHAECPDLERLARVMIRLVLQDTGTAMEQARRGELPDTYADPTTRPTAPDGAVGGAA